MGAVQTKNSERKSILPSAATSLGYGGVTALGLAALGTPLSWLVYAGGAVAAANYSREVSNNVNDWWYGTDTENPQIATDETNSINWWFSILWKLLAIGVAVMVFYYARKFIRNRTEEEKKSPALAVSSVAPAAAAPVAPATVAPAAVAPAASAPAAAPPAPVATAPAADAVAS